MAVNTWKTFYVTVTESYTDTFKVKARSEREAKRIVDDAIPDDYSPVSTGGGYERAIRVN